MLGSPCPGTSPSSRGSRPSQRHRPPEPRSSRKTSSGEAFWPSQKLHACDLALRDQKEGVGQKRSPPAPRRCAKLLSPLCIEFAHFVLPEVHRAIALTGVLEVACVQGFLEAALQKAPYAKCFWQPSASEDLAGGSHCPHHRESTSDTRLKGAALKRQQSRLQLFALLGRMSKLLRAFPSK